MEMLRSAVWRRKISFSANQSPLPALFDSVWQNGGVRTYHRTSVLEFGRNDGSSSTKSKPRDFSKAQKQRWRKKMALASQQKPHDGSTKLKSDAMIQQIDNPETDEFIRETSDSLLAGIRELMLPDGLQNLLAQFDGLDDEFQPDTPPPVELYDVVNRIMEYIEATQEKSSAAEPTSDKALTAIGVSPQEANEAMVIAAARGNKKYVESLMSMMDAVDLPIYPVTVKSVVNNFSEHGLYKFASHIFHKAVDYDVDIDEGAWSALVRVQCREGDIEGAMETMERLKKAGVCPADAMYEDVLQALVDAKRNDEAAQYWLEMKGEGVTKSVDGYNAMLQHSIQTFNPERAFWYIEEMKGSLRNLQPNLDSFVKLFRSCGEAPMWVNGFHDIIFDAMAIMEGAELVANTEVYDSIIYSFGKAGDAAAAEYYFWEMRQKGIEQTAATYNNLFYALASSQRVGSSSYMVRPRWVRPPEKELSEFHRLMLKAGAVEANKIVSSSYYSEGLLERGKRQKAPLHTTNEDLDEEELQEQISNEIRVNTAGQASKYEMVLKRDKIRKELRENETGRQISLSLLAKGVDPGPGKILHITPDLLESGEIDPMMNDLGMEDLWTDSDTAAEARAHSKRGNIRGSGGTSDRISAKEKADIEQAEKDMFGGMLDDNDPELEAFMKALEGSDDGDNVSFDSFLKNIDKSMLDEKEATDADDGREFLGTTTRRETLSGSSRKSMPTSNLSETPADYNSPDNESSQGNPMENLFRGMGGFEDNKFEELSRRLKDDLPEDKQRMIDELEDDINTGRFNVDNLDYDQFVSRYKESMDSPADDDISPRGIDEDVSEKKRVVVVRTPAVHKNPLIALLDNEPLPESPTDSNTTTPSNVAEEGRDEQGVITRDEVDRQWDQVLFGRCPDPDYSEPMHIRRNKNCTRADGLYNDMMERGVEPNTETLTRYMSVRSECGRLEGAIDIIDKMSKEHGLAPDEGTYHRLIRGHIFVKDIDGAVARLSEMKARDLKPDREMYGIVINSLSNRDRLVDALQLLEEAASQGLKIQNCHIKKLRARCAKLGVDHPDIYPDPNEWVKEVKERRKKSKHFPVGNKVHFARSLTFT